jgi:NitT/TauT family transport system ATP-binding protein
MTARTAMTAVPDTSPSGIAIEGIGHWFGDVQALSDVSLEVEAGTFVCFVGPSGCGKTTLLRILNGLITPSDGEVRVAERRVSTPPPGMSMVFQEHNLLPWRRALGNVEYGLELDGVAKRERRERAKEALARVGLAGFERAYPHQLSGGMRQRVGLARAWALDPAILLMDEPFGSLDAQTRERMQEQLLAMWEQDRKTVVFVTHDIEEAVYLADRVVMLSGRPGQVTEDLDVELGRPRPPECRMGQELQDYRRRISLLLRGEPNEA